MGREIRQVPPNWEHPKYSNGEYKPLYDRSCGEAISEWIANHNLWLEGKHPDQLEEPERVQRYKYYAAWTSPPDFEYYLPDIPEEEKTWYQVYETVSEGTPITPPFATEDELIFHLSNYGTDWDDGKKWSIEAAERFVKVTKWMPSGIFFVPSKS